MPIVKLQAKKPQGCDLCGEVAELRPYGPKGEWICFPCGMKNKKATEAAYEKRLSQGDERLGDLK